VRYHFIGVVVCVCVSALIPCKVSAWASKQLKGTVNGTHYRITKDVIDKDIDKDEYPDLFRFREILQVGSDSECHNLPDDNKKQWWGNGVGPKPETWFFADKTGDGQEGALSLYKKYSIKQAYERIGYELHCLQDEQVPAHKKRCCHGTWFVYLVDDMEFWALMGTFGYATSKSPWTYTLSYNKGADTFSYWLSDAEDDDNGDEKADSNDEINLKTGKLIKDGPDKWGIPKTDWGTYGQPPYVNDELFGLTLLEKLPGRNMGEDYYGDIKGNAILTHEQLKQSYDATLLRMKERSRQLPPLVPDDKKHGEPKISAKLFGPNKPVDVSFVAMENRQSVVLVSITADNAAIRDVTGKDWDGSSTATNTLAKGPNVDSLPWKDTIKVSWNGKLNSGDLCKDGVLTVRMKVIDQDKLKSEERERTVKYDKTKPTGTISVSIQP